MAVVLFIAVYAGLELSGVLIARQQPKALLARLEPEIRVVTPASAGPFPAVILLHGCEGLWNGDERRPIIDTYAAIAAEEGVIGIVVDSLKPRGIGGLAAILTVCSGLRLRGGERAGDAVVALSFARSLPFVDPSRLALAGWSHGGWTIMDLLAMDPERDAPPSLTDWPDGGLRGLVGTYLTYPYCGFPARARRDGFAWPVATWVVYGTDDRVADPQSCATVFAELTADVDSLAIADAGHAFDDPLNANYDGIATMAAHDRFRQFLRAVVIPGPA